MLQTKYFFKNNINGTFDFASCSAWAATVNKMTLQQQLHG